MAMTPLSSATPYCTPVQMLSHFSSEEVRSLCTGGPAVSPPTEVEILTTGSASNLILVNALVRASGEIEMAAMVGERYRPADLQALRDSGTVASSALTGLTADLCFWHLAKRRHPPMDQKEVPGAAEAYETLERLRVGEKVFPFEEVVEIDDIQATGDGESTSPSGGRGQRTRFSEGPARRYFGTRGGD